MYRLAQCTPSHPFAHVTYVVCSGDGAVGVKPGVEVFGRAEDFRQEEVEKRPELVQIVLKRRSGQQQPVRRLELPYDLGQF